ncbi:MAG: Smr/MutS family protein [candidate division Zixibacteria bacterium]|nr:Smr/MutS family protein [candidate division Zixibacteria bacterium]
MHNDDDIPVEQPLDGTLDLHTFQPAEIKALISDYIDTCLDHGIYRLRLIHGKGEGVLRRIVHAALDRHPAVKSYRHDSAGGSWGATVVDLHPDSASQS